MRGCGVNLSIRARVILENNIISYRKVCTYCYHPITFLVQKGGLSCLESDGCDFFDSFVLNSSSKVIYICC